MAASKTTKKRKRKPAAKQQPVGNRFQTEILILVMFAACLILMISAFGMGGIVGNAISAVCFGIMGLCAYIFPILLFAGVTFLIVNNTNRLAYKKVLAGVVFFVFLCGFLQLITEGYTPSTTFSDYYSLSSEYRTGGGVFGGAVCISTASAFGVEFWCQCNSTNVSCGPTVTRYELQPEMGVKVSKIVDLADDIKLNLAAADIRIEAPIPGKAAVGIEVPNKENSPVMLPRSSGVRGVSEAKSKLSFAVGKDIAGKPVVADIAKMPHLLIAGATGSGKSVCINTLIMSILYKADRMRSN